MKRIVSLALAGLLAAGTVAALAQPVLADGQYRHYRPGPAPGPGQWHGHGGGGWNAGGAFVGGTILGLALGTSLTSPPPPPPPTYVYVAPPPPPPQPVVVYASEAHI